MIKNYNFWILDDILDKLFQIFSSILSNWVLHNKNIFEMVISASTKEFDRTFSELIILDFSFVDKISVLGHSENHSAIGKCMNAYLVPITFIHRDHSIAHLSWKCTCMNSRCPCSSFQRKSTIFSLAIIEESHFNALWSTTNFHVSLDIYRSCKRFIAFTPVNLRNCKRPIASCHNFIVTITMIFKVSITIEIFNRRDFHTPFKVILLSAFWFSLSQRWFLWSHSSSFFLLQVDGLSKTGKSEIFEHCSFSSLNFKIMNFLSFMGF